MRRIAFISQAACSLAFILGITSAQAGSYAVNPVRVSLSAAQPTGSLTVRNDGTEATTVQLELRQWSQQDGKEVLQPTEDLLATPPIFTVPAGGRQVIRVGLRQRPDVEQELTYRLLLQELPMASEEAGTGLKMALNISLPVFIKPAVESRPVMHWTATRNAAGTLALSVRNSGNAHVKVTRLSLYDDAESPLLDKATSEYVLAGESREWSLGLAEPFADRLTLHAVTNAGDHRAIVDVTEL